MSRIFYIRVLVLVFIVLIFVSYRSYYCFILRLTPLPEEIVRINGSVPEQLLFLYGKNICVTCPVGKYLVEYNDNERIAYIVPLDFTECEKENLAVAFNLKGKIINGNAKIEAFLKKVLSCLKAKNILGNYLLELGKNGKTKKVTTF
jgi:hypothetical protein